MLRHNAFRLNVFDKALRDQRWQIIGFGLALALMASTSVWLWPSLRDTLQNFEFPAAVEAFFGGELDFATAAGYLSGRYFGWTVVLVIVYAIIAGTGAIAGEESAGTMDLLLSQPISRTRLVVEKMTATALGATAIVLLGYAGFLISVPTVDIDVSLIDLLLASLNMLPIALLFAALSVWAGAVLPNRGTASALGIAVTVATYFLYTITSGIGWLEPLRYGSPFYYYGGGRSIIEGLPWWHVVLLLGLAAALAVLALRAFERRDVSLGAATDLSVRAIVRRAAAVRTGV